MGNDTVLETEDLAKDFAGFVAVRGVNLRVARGSIHAMIGPNGAGKTTCFNLLTKFLTPTRGRIVFDGRDITALQAGGCGAARHGAFVSDLGGISASDRARECAHCVAAPPRRLIRFLALQKRAARARRTRQGAPSPMSGCPPIRTCWRPNYPMAASGRSRSRPRWRSIRNSSCWTSRPPGMGHDDIGRISALIKSVAATRTVLMVEHNLSVVADLCDRITVLTRGQILAEGDYQTVSADPAVREAYLGTGHA